MKVIMGQMKKTISTSNIRGSKVVVDYSQTTRM